MLGIISVENKAVITSGAYERYFEDETTGKTYHHILDPQTGYPANNGLISVTVVSEQGMLADGLSTACYVMGLEKTLQYWREYGENFDLVLMTEEGEVYVTEPLASSFTSDFTVHIVTEEGITNA
jgi:thiamine biosynthesis lipoprotein